MFLGDRSQVNWGAVTILLSSNHQIIQTMKKILVPCDFSKPAISAFRFALDVAAQSKGKVYLLNVVELPVLHDTVMMPVLNFEAEMLRELKEKAEQSFSKLISKHEKEGVKVVREVVFGPVSREILDFTKRENLDLIIMGTHGASGLREFVVGSNAEKIVRSSPVPVLTVKDYSKGAVKNIVFPNTLDTEHQEDLTMKVKALQNFFKAHLNIVWINTPINFSSDTETFSRLEAFAKRYMLKDYSIHVFNHRDEETGILEFTNSIKGDLVAMATHGRKGIGHLLNGSLAEDVVNHTKGLVWSYSLKNEPAAV
jgi:nucleotide-binding universal stress UspA family protein